jgi:hypothetical protein
VDVDAARLEQQARRRRPRDRARDGDRDGDGSVTTQSLVDAAQAVVDLWLTNDVSVHGRDAHEFDDLIAALGRESEPYAACAGSTNGQACFSPAVYCVEHSLDDDEASPVDPIETVVEMARRGYEAASDEQRAEFDRQARLLARSSATASALADFIRRGPDGWPGS